MLLDTFHIAATTVTLVAEVEDVAISGDAFTRLILNLRVYAA